MAQRIDDDTRARALADLAAGESLRGTARKYGIGTTTLLEWSRQGGKHIIETATVDLGALVADYIAAGLRALKAQAELATDPEYLREQTAGDLAVLHGVMSDKLVRILAGLEAGQREEHEALNAGPESP